MTHDGWRESETASTRYRRRTGRLSWLFGMLVVGAMMWGPFGAGATEELAAAQADDPEAPRGLRVNTSEASPGYVLFNPNRSPTTYLVDLEGRVVHTWQSDAESGGGAYLLDNGHLLRGVREPDVAVFRGGGQSGRLRELTWDGEAVWDFTFASEEHLLHHDMAVMPNGNILAVAWERKSAEEATRAGRLATLTPEAGLWPDMIVEFEPQPPDGARIVWEWHMWDHTIQSHHPEAENFGDPTEHPERIDLNGDREPPELSADDRMRVEALGFVPEGMDLDGVASDFMHTNAVSYNAVLDQIVVSVPRFNEIWVIDHSTTTEEAAGRAGGRWGRGGDLLYRWGNPAVYGRGEAAGRRLGYQHDVRWIPVGIPSAGHLTLFNNNVDDPDDGTYSAVFELVPPTDDTGRYLVPDAGPFGPEEPLWKYMAPNRADFFSRRISGVHRLASGHTFITSGRPGRFFEVTPEGEIVWEYLNPYAGTLRSSQTNNSPYGVFRATKIAPGHPSLVGRDLTPLDPQPAFVPPADGSR